jgi:hypothetical protein
MIVILDSTINIIANYAAGGDLYDHSMNTRILNLMINKMFSWIPKLRGKWLQHQLDFANHLVPILCFICIKKVGWLRKSNHLRGIYPRVTLDYGQEVHRSVKTFNPKQGYLSQRLVWRTIKSMPLKLEFSGGQVSCQRVWDCPRHLTTNKLP